ncbi:hypothetical protein Vadar_033941 [Vaccinium darrowii]|uniref:Uncharacterized protein n=1 Tax=Vaccinium darrowii TaxID=229202 RepID=A0ACB7ZG21_9ERIC|nr:hypothetical protein Vadar_033941 [Vaccinium darrowii]
MNSRFLFDAGRRFFHGNRFQFEPYTKTTRLPTPRIQQALVRIQREVPWGQLLRGPRFVVFGSCVLFALLFVRIERIPISRRFHVVLLCKMLERKLEEWQFRTVLNENQGKILPPDSPQSIRVQRILREIVQGMHSGLRLEKDCTVRVHERNNPVKMIPRGTGNELLVHNNKAMGRSTQKRVRKFGWKFATKHLDGLNWEVMVVNSSICNACYVPNGKIVIFTGLLNKLKSDGEVAVVLGHEVGHGFARHPPEHLFTALWVLIVGLIGALWVLTFDIFLPPPYQLNLKLLVPVEIMLSFISRRREREADYIGMMLMASARYDPRLAPVVYETKFDDEDIEESHDIFSTHPCGRERARQLENVMEQAMAIYRGVTIGLGVRSFI